MRTTKLKTNTTYYVWHSKYPFYKEVVILGFSHDNTRYYTKKKEKYAMVRNAEITFKDTKEQAIADTVRRYFYYKHTETDRTYFQDEFLEEVEKYTDNLLEFFV